MSDKEIELRRDRYLMVMCTILALALLAMICYACALDNEAKQLTIRLLAEK